jgi:hypothetical protein
VNYTLQIDLGDGFAKTDAALDSILSKLDDINSMKLDFEIDKSGFLTQGEKAGETFVDGLNKKLAPSIKEVFKRLSMKEAMDDLARHGDSKSTIDKQANFAMQDYKINKGKEGENLPIDKMKVLFAGIATLFNPFVGARLLSDIVPKGGMSGGKGVSGAIFGAAGAAGYGEIFVIVKSLELAFKLLIGAIKKTVEAYDYARNLYAKSLTSGLNLNFTVKRSMLADVLGVSETEVIRFGAALNYLNPRLDFASRQLAQSAPALAGVGWEFKILEKNISALWSEIAQGLAPMVKTLISEFNDFMSTLGNSGNLKFLASVCLF